MRCILFVILSISLLPVLTGQQSGELLEGEISYITGSHVYVKFESTKDITTGDTLLLFLNNDLQPALLVNNKSSISCVCSKLTEFLPQKGMKVFFQPKLAEIIVERKGRPLDKDTTSTIERQPSFDTVDEEANIDPAMPHVAPEKPKPDIYGRITASTYTSLRNMDLSEIDDPRMRYTFSFRNKNISGSNFHFNSYFSFKHQIRQWDDVTNDFNRAFKAYNLSLSYIDDRFEFGLGRKVNRSISNIGAVDGVQFKYKLKSLSLGVVLGTRPDVYNYSFNFSLPQAGIFLEHNIQRSSKSINSTIAFFEQRSGQNTDRRFLYFQHSNNLIEKLYLFGSCEMDLYEKVGDEIKNDLKITSLYISARYRFNRNYSLFLSYDNRRNIIYYETYKNAVDRLLEQETRQGFRLRFVVRPLKYVSIGIGGTYRFQKNSLSPTKNGNIYLNYSRVPLLNASASLSYTFLDTYFLNSHIAGLRIRKDLLKGKLSLGTHYRWVQYIYDSATSGLNNQIAGLDLSIAMKYELSLIINHEVNFSSNDIYQRSYVKLIKRIR